MAIRYYWFAFDEIAMPYYASLARAGRDPVELILRPAAQKLSGGVETILERTPLALRFYGAESGSIILKVAGVLAALRGLVAWLPIYGKWIQEKGRIDIDTEIKRSKALSVLKANFIKAGITEDAALRLALQRLHYPWPDFYAPQGFDLTPHIRLGSPEPTGNQLSLNEGQIGEVIPAPEIGMLPPASSATPPPTDDGHREKPKK